MKEGSKGHDLLKDNKRVQVKTTQKNSIGMGLKKQEFEHLIAIKIYENGKYEIVFDGPGNKVSNEFHGNSIKVAKLRELNHHRKKKFLN